MLTDTQQAELRRMLGYPAIGKPIGSNNSVGSMFSAFRIFDPTGALETRMQNLQESEEVQIFGDEHPAFANYPQPFGETFFDEDANKTYYGYVPIIRVLQSDVTNARTYLAYSKADVVNFNPMEIRARRSMLQEKRLSLANFLVVPLAPDLITTGSRYRRR